MNYKISIIVPVYNTEKYISECINSLLSQTYNNYEIIIIDDGSTDNSYKICKDYEKKHKKIKLYSQKNSGVSSARNLGIKVSSGDFIIFVDSDDYCNSNYLETIKDNLHEDELLGFGFEKTYTNKKITILLNSFYCNNKDEMDEFIIANSKFGGYICNKVFSTKILKQNNILFDKELYYSEDLKFTIDYIKYCNAIRYISFTPYMYRMRKSSVSFNYINKKNSSLLDLLNELINKYNYNEKIVNSLKYIYLLNYYKFKKVYDEKKVRKDIIQDKEMIIKNKKLTRKEKIMFYIHSHPFIYFICKKIKSKIEKTYD